MSKNKPWVDSTDIIVFDGTKNALDVLAERLRKLGWSVEYPTYDIPDREFVSFTVFDPDRPDWFKKIVKDRILVFYSRDGVDHFKVFKTLDDVQKKVRLRTGISKITVTIQTDDKVFEYEMSSSHSTIDVTNDVDQDSYGVWYPNKPLRSILFDDPKFVLTVDRMKKLETSGGFIRMTQRNVD